MDRFDLKLLITDKNKNNKKTNWPSFCEYITS